MNKAIFLIGFLIQLVLVSNYTYAQENKIKIEDTSEVFLEDYTDDFQEFFFEALKQKGIENYDRAINLLLECKLLDKDNNVVDHELAKVYLADKKYVLAQKHSIEALVSQPTNFWYLNTFVAIIQKQGNTIDNVVSRIPYKNIKLKENLALIYFKESNYEEAKAILKDLKKSAFTKSLLSKINDSIENKKPSHKKQQSVQNSNTNHSNFNTSQGFQAQIKKLILATDFKQLNKVSTQAIEHYPLQPYFYYAQGLAFNKMGNHKEAIEILETGLDYLIDTNQSLANDMYTVLANAYASIHNTAKSNMYLRKIKP